MPAPVAPIRPHVHRAHGDERVDDYAWLRDRDDPEVLKYLEAENAWTEARTAHTAQLRDELFEEMRVRIQETDTSAPVPFGPYRYFSRTVEGLQYEIHCRTEAAGAETVLIDENELAEGHEFFDMANFALSPDHRLATYATDTTGGERFTLRVRDLALGTDLPDVVPDIYYGVAWSTHNSTFFYVRPDAAMRPFQVWRHALGTPADDDVLVYQEDDERYFVAVHLERSREFILVESESKITSEVRFLPAGDPTAPLTLVHPREHGLEYGVEHHGDRFFVLTNADGAENFKVMETPVASPGRESWTEVVPHRPDTKVQAVAAFHRHIVLSEREGGLSQLRILPLDGGEPHVIEQPEPVYTLAGAGNPEFDADRFRFTYTSLVTPRSVFAYDVRTRERELVKQQPVLGGYDASQFVTERVWATAPDGVEVPVSVVHRRDVARDGTAPTLLYGYGSYETSIDPAFSSLRLSLAERGVVFAIAHIRGGGELGRPWYDAGKLLHKRTTFTDFIAAAEHLVAEGYTSPDRLVARGGSAGGLLMGAVANLRPDLFRAIVAEVPFVDCLTTILDETLPLTVTEWEEWGNPKADPDVYRYMKSYSPYDNVAPKVYPAMLVTAGLNDPRVSYWEPAKWVAKLRATRTDDRELLLKTEMGAGHMGPSGRYDVWKDEAFVYAFILDQLGLA